MGYRQDIMSLCNMNRRPKLLLWKPIPSAPWKYPAGDNSRIIPHAYAQGLCLCTMSPFALLAECYISVSCVACEDRSTEPSALAQLSPAVKPCPTCMGKSEISRPRRSRWHCCVLILPLPGCPSQSLLTPLVSEIPHLELEVPDGCLK